MSAVGYVANLNVWNRKVRPLYQGGDHSFLSSRSFPNNCGVYCELQKNSKS